MEDGTGKMEDGMGKRVEPALSEAGDAAFPLTFRRGKVGRIVLRW